MAENDDDSGPIYETDERGERVIVRSLVSEQPAHVRFINSVTRPVDVWWRDFQGYRKHFVRMQPRTYFNIDTYVTHPWEFTDPTTKENYVVQNKKIFRVPSCLAGVQHRTNWFICVQVRSLRRTVLLVLAQRLNDLSRVPRLGLPRELSNDLGDLIYAIQNTPPPPPRPWYMPLFIYLQKVFIIMFIFVIFSHFTRSFCKLRFNLYLNRPFVKTQTQ